MLLCYYLKSQDIINDNTIFTIKNLVHLIDNKLRSYCVKRLIDISFEQFKCLSLILAIFPDGYHINEFIFLIVI